MDTERVAYPLSELNQADIVIPDIARMDARRLQLVGLPEDIPESRELANDMGKSKLAEIIRYTLSRRAAFERFLADGRIEIDSNIVERAIRPQTITRPRPK